MCRCLLLHQTCLYSSSDENASVKSPSALDPNQWSKNQFWDSSANIFYFYWIFIKHSQFQGTNPEWSLNMDAGSLAVWTASINDGLVELKEEQTSWQRHFSLLGTSLSLCEQRALCLGSVSLLWMFSDWPWLTLTFILIWSDVTFNYPKKHCLSISTSKKVTVSLSYAQFLCSRWVKGITNSPGDWCGMPGLNLDELQEEFIYSLKFASFKGQRLLCFSCVYFTMWTDGHFFYIMDSCRTLTALPLEVW